MRGSAAGEEAGKAEQQQASGNESEAIHDGVGFQSSLGISQPRENTNARKENAFILRALARSFSIVT